VCAGYAGTLNRNNGQQGGIIAFKENMSTPDATVGVCPTLQDENFHAVAFDTTQVTSKANYSNPKPGDPCHPLASGQHPPAVAFPLDTQNCTEGHASGGKGFGGSSDPMFTLSKGHSHAVAFKPSHYTRAKDGAPSSVVAPLTADADKGDQDTVVAAPVQVQWASGGGQIENPTMQALRANAEYNYQFIRNAMAVRRLTPRECERLQGFPDGYTDVRYRGKSAADGPRYRALGNSMAVPVMAWIGRRIQMVKEATDGR